jgi:hypothetical protein
MAHMYLLLAALVLAGCAAVLISSRRLLKRTSAELRFEFQRQIDSLSASVRALERGAEARNATSPISAAGAPGEAESWAGKAGSSSAAQAQPPLIEAPEEVTPETLATITETISALLGRKVHIRSVKILQTPNAIVNPWAQHGRAVVQASRNFASRRRES